MVGNLPQQSISETRLAWSMDLVSCDLIIANVFQAGHIGNDSLGYEID